MISKCVPENVLKWSQHCGYDFAGNIKDTFDEFYN
jgi:hypothetical protein